MSENQPSPEQPSADDAVILDPQDVEESRGTGGDEDGESDEAAAERHVTELVEQPAKVMRIGTMIRTLLEEVKSAPLDEASRSRLKEIHEASIRELEEGLAPELIAELDRISLPFTEGTPSESELRIAQAQLVGWLEGLFHGIQAAIHAQQVASRAQLEQMHRALPAGMMPQPGGTEAGGPEQPGTEGGTPSGMYL